MVINGCYWREGLIVADAWYLYVLECEGGRLYTGIAVDVEKRFALHVAGKGARYTRSRKPLRIMAVQEFPDRSAALRAEYALKQLTPAGKLAFCASHSYVCSGTG